MTLYTRETTPRLLPLSTRWDRDVPRFFRDRDLSKVCLETITRPQLQHLVQKFKRMKPF